MPTAEDLAADQAAVDVAEINRKLRNSTPTGTLRARRSPSASARRTGALTVPSSAVHTDGSRRTVTVPDDGTQRSVAVTTGVIGPDLTEIASGPTEGQTVVLADLTAVIPTSTASSRAGSGALGSGRGFTGEPAAIPVVPCRPVGLIPQAFH